MPEIDLTVVDSQADPAHVSDIPDATTGESRAQAIAAAVREAGLGCSVGRWSHPDGNHEFYVSLDDRRLILRVAVRSGELQAFLDADLGGTLTPEVIKDIVVRFLMASELATGWRCNQWHSVDEFHDDLVSDAEEEGIPEDHAMFTSIVVGAEVKIASALRRARADASVPVEVRFRAVGSHRELFARATTPHDGEVVLHLPDEVVAALLDIRRAFFEEGKGVWYSVRITVDKSRSPSFRAEYDTENEPGWSTLPGSQVYAEDLEQFPRDPATLPVWLRRRLREATG